RNVNSLTFRKGITLDEVRTFVLIFAETASQIKNRGGVKGILDSKGVTHIVVDQFKYGIITDDGQAEKDDMTSDEKALDNLVFTEIVNKIKQGGDLGDVNAEGVAAAFQSLMSGSYKKDAKSRANLAQMILSLDPSLADQALFASGGLKDAMSWSTARTTINQLLDDIGRGKPENRVHALENLAKMADMAISKNKDTTINEMVTRLNERIWFKERDIDVNAQIFDVLVDFFKALIVAYKHTAAMEIIRQIEKLDRTLDNLPDDKQDNYTRALKELCATSFVQASAEATVEVLMRELESDVMSIADQAMKILETLRTEQVVEQLLEGFKNDSRTTRNRCFQTLMAIGPKALEVCVWKVKNLDDPSMFPRRDTVGTLDDSAFYVARNAIDLIAKLGGASEMDVLRKAASDKDARVRREVLSAMPKVDATEAGHMAANFLQDPSKDVVEVAINTLGMLQDQSAAGKLIDLFYADPDIRAAVINALGKIGGKEAEELMLPATRFRFGGHLVQIYKTNEELRLLAIRNLGLLGREPARNALKKFVGRWTNPIIRPLFFPLG
ncbi:HEAT repeat domain-containing protein, partial [bacterium]|nr:HEAT repeat domain-containing protein [bacterium]